MLVCVDELLEEDPKEGEEEGDELVLATEVVVVCRVVAVVVVSALRLVEDMVVEPVNVLKNSLELADAEVPDARVAVDSDDTDMMPPGSEVADE